MNVLRLEWNYLQWVPPFRPLNRTKPARAVSKTRLTIQLSPAREKTQLPVKAAEDISMSIKLMDSTSELLPPLPPAQTLKRAPTGHNGTLHVPVLRWRDSSGLFESAGVRPAELIDSPAAHLFWITGKVFVDVKGKALNI